jgi:hypothetical protein
MMGMFFFSNVLASSSVPKTTAFTFIETLPRICVASIVLLPLLYIVALREQKSKKLVQNHYKLNRKTQELQRVFTLLQNMSEKLNLLSINSIYDDLDVVLKNKSLRLEQNEKKANNVSLKIEFLCEKCKIFPKKFILIKQILSEIMNFHGISMV